MKKIEKKFFEKNFAKAQAAIFDGIMFLLFASTSVALVFVFLNGYGIAQDEAMRSSYLLAYLQDAAKSLFYIDVRTLGDVARDDEVVWFDPNSGVTPPSLLAGRPVCTSSNGAGCPYWDLLHGDEDSKCEILKTYFSTTIADLVKKDLSDSDFERSVTLGTTTGSDTSAAVCLDNHFGLRQTSPGVAGTTACDSNEPSVPRAHGLTALRCAMKELMKSFQLSGYYYLVEVVNQEPAEHSIPLPADAPRITNYWRANEDPKWTGCKDPIDRGYLIGTRKREFQVLTVAMPFRVPRSETLQQMRNFVLRICIWPGRT